MYDKYVDILSLCLASVFKEMTGATLSAIKIEARAFQASSLPVAQVIEYQGRDEPLSGHFVLGFPTEKAALNLANSLAAKMGYPKLDGIDEAALDLLGEFLNTVVGRTISSWDRMGMPVNFGTPSSLQQAQLKPVEGYDYHAYAIALQTVGGNLVFNITFSQAMQCEEDNRRLLVVEDSRTFRFALVKALVGADYDVAEAGDGKEAVEMYQIFRPRLVIMDLVMPKMGGLDAMMAIRELDHKAKFVVLTSSSRRDEVVTAQTLGVLNYLIKPVDPQRLLEVVNKACKL